MKEQSFIAYFLNTLSKLETSKEMLMKCGADDIAPSLTRLKNHGSELKSFVSIFRKLSQINNIKSRKVATFENCENFSNHYFTYVRNYKVTL